MSLFKKLFGKTEPPETNSETQSPREKLINQETEKLKALGKEKEKYVELAKLLIETNDSETLKKVTTKIDKYLDIPETVFVDDEYYYDTQNNQFQAYRGAGKELNDFPLWFILIDTLQIEKYLWELDWKTGPEETNDILKELAKRKSYILPEISQINTEGMQSLDDYFVAVNKTISADGLIVIELQIDSDSYVTSLIKSQNFENLVQHSNAINRNITTYL